jgi:Tol biopolymer transport system component
VLLKSQELGGPTLWLNSDLARIDRIYKNIEPGGEVFNWYPDNRKFLIRAEIGGDALWLVDVSTGEYTVLAVPGLGRVEGAAASPDGLWIIYSIYRGQKLGGEIWLVDHTGRNANLLTATQGLANNFSWSPDGKKVVYFESGLNILDVGTRMISNYVIVGHPGENQIYWSPASDRIMFVSGSHILLVGLNGEERSVSFDNLKDYRSPVWSPDGSKIIFIAKGPDRVLNIYVFDLEFDVLEILIENIDPEAHFIIIK